MYQINSIVNNYKYRIICKDQIIYKDNNDNLICKNLKSSEIIWQNDKEKNIPLSSGRFCYKNFYFSNEFRGTSIFNIDTGEKIDLLNQLAIESFIFNNNSFITCSNSRQKKFGKFDVQKMKMVWEINYINYSSKTIGFNDSIILLSKKTNLFCFDINNGTLLWQKDLSEIQALHYKDYLGDQQSGKIRKCIAIYKNKIYLAVNNNAIVILDTESGEILKIISEIEDGQTWDASNGKPLLVLVKEGDEKKWTNHDRIFNTVPFPPSAVYLAEQQKIAGLAVSTYWELEVSSDTIKVYDCSESFKPIEAVAGGNIPYLRKENHLIFCSGSQQLAAFNIKSKKIDWQHNFDFQEGQWLRKNTLSISGDWMIINDNQKNSYIFQRQ